jgi:transposase
MGRPSRYPAEFRQEAFRLALVSDESRAAVARRLGINETTLRKWVADHLAEETRGSDPLAIAVIITWGRRPSLGLKLGQLYVTP